VPEVNAEVLPETRQIHQGAEVKGAVTEGFRALEFAWHLPSGSICWRFVCARGEDDLPGEIFLTDERGDAAICVS